MRMKIAILLLVCLIYAGCTTSRAVIADSVNLSNYNYATIINVMSYGGSPDLMDLEVRVFNSLSATRLRVIGDREIPYLTNSQRQELLLVRFSASQMASSSSIAINFVEYATGRPVASFTGTSEVGMNSAINSAVNRMQRMF